MKNSTWYGDILSLLLHPISLLGTLVSALLLFCLVTSDVEDSFGKGILIPPDMNVAEPLETFPAEPGITDPAGDLLFQKLAQQDASAPVVIATMTTDLTFLREFSGPQRQVLLRYLACDARWFLSQEHGKLYAFRRFVKDGMWINSLNGYYTAGTFDVFSRMPHFQVRAVIGPDGPVFSDSWENTAITIPIPGAPFSFLGRADPHSEQYYESYLVCESNAGSLEIYEQSLVETRLFTPPFLSQVASEFDAVLSSPQTKKQGFDDALLATGSFKQGNSELCLVHGMQGGLYHVVGHLNPGERGYVYLKAFEATQNTPLSTSRLPERSTEFIGWSNNPNQQFLYQCEITIYEGDWGTFYPARFEVWFVPDSGKPERKLLEKIFKIEGWQQ